MLRRLLRGQIDSGTKELRRYCERFSKDLRDKQKVEEAMKEFSKAVNERLKHLDQVVRDLLQMVSHIHSLSSAPANSQSRNSHGYP